MASAVTLPLLLTLLLSSSSQSLSLTPDGALLLAFRYAVSDDPLSLLQNWRYSDPTPCSWTGVTCQLGDSRVTRLDLHNARITGSLAPEIGLLDHLQYLDLSGNLFNGTLPSTLFNASKLQTLSLADNAFSGGIPTSFAGMNSLGYLNLSGNALAGDFSHNLGNLPNLKVASLKGNRFSGGLPHGIVSGEVLDFSSNLFTGSVPSDIGGAKLKYLNLSSNKLSGTLAPDLGKVWPETASIDLRYNNLTGPIPEAKALAGQKSDAFVGNPGLCGKPLKDPCMIPSTLSAKPKPPGSISPAIAVIPREVGSDNMSNTSSATPIGGDSHSGLRPATIVGITVADLAGIGLLGLLLTYLYRWMRKNRAEGIKSDGKNPNGQNQHQVSANFSATPSPAVATGCCFIKVAETEAATTTDGSSSSGSEETEEHTAGTVSGGGGGGKLVMVDGETEMEMEMLMKASAYILGTSGSGIVYKAVLQDGTAFAVRRLGEGGERVRRENFEGHVKAVAKLRHPNVVRLRGFYWGSTEKLVVSDFVSNGSLASISGYKKNRSSPCHLSFKIRMKIARGVARGLNYIHEKKFVHGNLKPSNILLTQEMEPLIGDLGINWIIHGCKGSGSGRQFGSKRSIPMPMAPYDVAQDPSVSGSPYVNPLDTGNGPTSPYQPPELLKSLKASTKWDVYSFGVILLELLTGKVFFDRELGQWTPGSGIEDKYWALRMADVAIRADVQGREEAMVGVFKLGFQCASMVPQKRPSMREALQVLEKIGVSCG